MATDAAQILKRGQNKRAFLYRQLSGILQEQIAAGQYRPGERLPSMDELAATYQLNKGTVREAIGELIKDGLIYSVPAQGTFVSGATTRTSATGKKRETLTVGVVSTVMVPDQTGPYHLELLEAIRRQLQERDANMLVMPVANLEPQEAVVKRVMEAGVDGVICIGPFRKATLEGFVGLKVPVVLLDHIQAGVAMDMIAIDNFNGGYLAIDHLIGLGRTRVAVIAGEIGQPATCQRLEGAKQRMREAGLGEDFAVEYANFLTEKAREAMTKLMMLSPCPTGVFCMNDEMAAGALQAVREQGRLHVPEDVAVVGFDDSGLATRVYPQLTTISVPKGQMARLAILQLCDQLGDAGHVPSVTTVGTKLVIRGSSGG